MSDVFQVLWGRLLAEIQPGKSEKTKNWVNGNNSRNNGFRMFPCGRENMGLCLSHNEFLMGYWILSSVEIRGE